VNLPKEFGDGSTIQGEALCRTYGPEETIKVTTYGEEKPDDPAAMADIDANGK